MVSIAAFQVDGLGSNPCGGETPAGFFVLILKCQVTGNYLGHALKNKLFFLAIMVFILSFI